MTREEALEYIEAYLKQHGPLTPTALFAHLKANGWRTNQSSHDVRELVRAGRVERLDLDTGRIYRAPGGT